MKSTLEEFHRVDILMNNVGASFITPVLKLTESGCDAMVRPREPEACFHVQQGSGARYDREEGGSIINRASGSAGVSIKPGAKALTRMRYGAHSTARVMVRLITPPLAAYHRLG